MMFAINPLPKASVSHAMPAESADHALVRAAADGDRHAFERLYRRHSARVFAVILRLQGGDRARAEDLTQDAFVRVWQKLPEFRFESAFSTWLHRLAVNTALMALRSARGEPGADEDVSDPEFHLADGMARLPDLGIDLDKVIAKLPPRARRARAARCRGLETRRNFRRARHGRRFIQGAVASRPQPVEAMARRSPWTSLNIGVC